MRRALPLLLVAWLGGAGCGARSPLSTPEPQARDAGLGDHPTEHRDGAIDEPPPLRDGSIEPLPPPDGGGTVPIDPGPRREVVSAGWRHSCALREGRVLCWGHDGSGQLGTGAFDDEDAPVEVGLADPVIEISAGMQHTCARSIRGEIWCWGSNLNGQLGNAGLGHESTPQPSRVPGIVGALGITAAGQHTCALLADRTAACWGHGAFGQLGDGTRASRDVPIGVAMLDRIVQLEAGWRHTCALRDDGSVYCWGYNFEGQLGVSGIGETATPTRVAGVEAEQISAGSYHSCALAADATVICWGSSGPYGRAPGPFLPARMRGIAGALQIGAGENGRACVVQVDGGVTCFVIHADPHCDPASPWCTPTDVLRLPGAGAYRFSSGFEHSCIALRDGGVACWGSDDFGQLGDGPGTTGSIPTHVVGL